MPTVSKTNFACHFCNANFSTNHALGGHVSKAHSGQSKTYKRKLEVRMKRQTDRDCLKIAKDQFLATTNKDPKKHRSHVRKMKN